MAVADRTRTGVPAPRAGAVARRPVVSVVAVLAGLAGVGWWLSPTAFEPWRGSESVSLTAPLAPQGAALLPLPPTSGPVQVWHAEARVRTDGPSSVLVVVCDGGDPLTGTTSVTGTVGAGGTVDGCDGVRPAAGERVVPPSRLAVLVAPGGGQDVLVEGVDVLYLDGLRPGYQRTGERFRAAWTPAD